MWNAADQTRVQQETLLSPGDILCGRHDNVQVLNFWERIWCIVQSLG